MLRLCDRASKCDLIVGASPFRGSGAELRCPTGSKLSGEDAEGRPGSGESTTRTQEGFPGNWRDPIDSTRTDPDWGDTGVNQRPIAKSGPGD